MAKRNWKPGLNAMVQRQKQRRRARNWQLVRFVVMVTSVAGLIASEIHMAHVRQNQTPPWANFTFQSAPTQTQYVRQFNGDGVPVELLINGEDWDVVKVAQFDDVEDATTHKKFASIEATTFCQKKTIAYLEAPNPVVLRANIWHEVMHAGGCVHGGDTWWNSINPTWNKHDGVKHLGNFLAEFSMANPDFMNWLRGN